MHFIYIIFIDIDIVERDQRLKDQKKDFEDRMDSVMTGTFMFIVDKWISASPTDMM